MPAAAASRRHGQTHAIAAELPSDQGAGRDGAAADAFTGAMGIGFVVAGAAAIAKRRLPTHHRAEEADNRRAGWKLALQPGLPRP
jgi:hypothetical protein